MIEKYTLKNGLTVLLEPIESVVSISAGLWIKSGSRHEKNREKGYAHFIEHMLFKGTENFTAKEIAQIVDRVGGQHNAVTNREYTSYFINVISDFLDPSVQLLADMYYRSLFSGSDIEREKNVIIEEIRMYEDAPDEIIHDIFMETMLRNHPLGNPILGSAESIMNASRDSLLGFFDRHYTSNNSLFVIAGKFNMDEAKASIEKYFSNDLNNNPHPETDILPFTKREYRKHIDRDLEQVHFCLGTEGLKKDDDDRWALFILSTILGGSMSSRLFQNIREKEGLCYSIYSFHSSYTDNGVFGIYCGTSPENYKRVLDLIIDECRDIISNGITTGELDDVKAYIRGNLALSLESTEVRMGQLARNEMTYGRFYTFEDVMEQLGNVKMVDFKRVCDKILKDKRLTVVSLGKLKDKNHNSADFYI
ncbi:MAG: insulinase family protein [Spirochaetes bacterium]|jgi:predicted Zn-dependent peptidase|nr:insulinase family protein [Spirochaetota bacterium]